MKNTQVRQKSAPIKCKNTKGSGKPTCVQYQRYTWVIIKRKLVFLMIGRLLQIICLMWWLMFTSPACPALYFDSYGIEDGLMAMILKRFGVARVIDMRCWVIWLKVLMKTSGETRGLAPLLAE
jgi:hypothetical protein